MHIVVNVLGVVLAELSFAKHILSQMTSTELYHKSTNQINTYPHYLFLLSLLGIPDHFIRIKLYGHYGHVSFILISNGFFFPAT